jgi:pyruvate dehydrogenase E2 component (dihydrolipoamide acetyltransferase)
LHAVPDVTLPRLSDAMQEGTVVRWLKADGDAVQPGDELAEIDTGAGTATATFEADAGGVLRRVAREGQTVALGGVLATISVDNAAPHATVPDVPPLAAAEPATKKGDVTVEELSRAQQGVARRVAEAKAIVPELSVTAEADMTDAVELLARLAAEHAPAPTAGDLVVKAAAVALRGMPRANGAYRDAQFELFSRVNVGVAVTTSAGAVVPTLFDADRRTVAELAAEARTLAGRVLDGTIKAPELSGGTFTVWSVAAQGATALTPIITAGQAAVLGVGAVHELPRVVGGEVVARHVLTLTLVADARILYATDAAELLARIRALLEAPAALVG